VLLTILLARIPFGDVVSVLSSARREWLGAALGVMLASNILGAWQWERLLAAAGIRMPFWKVCAYYHVGLFFNNFLPANIGGDIARVLGVSRHGPGGHSSAVSAVIMDRLVGTVALAGMALVTTVPAIDKFHLSLVYLAVVAFFILSVVLVWAIFHPRLLPTIERLLARVGFRSLGPHLDDLAERLRHFRDRRSMFVGLLALALVVQLMRVGVHVLVARALGLNIPLVYFLLFVPLLAVIVSLPISLNGIGVREGAGVVLFGLVGVGRTQAFSLQFATYLVAVTVSLLGGLAFLVRTIRRRTSPLTTGRSI
jgi:uncharacterized protein (TIRG00374 family)